MKRISVFLFFFLLSLKMFAQPCGMSMIVLSTFTAPCGQCASAIQVGASGGTAPYSYVWSTGATTDSVSGLCPGTYTCTVTDADSCVSWGSITITSPAGPTVSATLLDASCDSCCDGMGMVAISGGTAPFSVVWSDNQTTDTATGLCPGKYTVCVTDANGCTSCDTVQVESPAGIYEASSFSFGLFPNPATNELHVILPSQLLLLQVKIYSLTGSLVFSGKEKTIDVSALAAGTYMLEVRTEIGVSSRRFVKE